MDNEILKEKEEVIDEKELLRRREEEQVERVKRQYETDAKEKEEALALLRETNERTVAGLRDGYERTLDELKSGHMREVEAMKSAHEKAVGKDLLRAHSVLGYGAVKTVLRPEVRDVGLGGHPRPTEKHYVIAVVNEFL
mgnify:CR=1 FL=1